MTVYQTTQNGYMAFKAQSGLGTAASGSGATFLRLTGGGGLHMTRAQTPSAEVRRDGMSTRGRLGTQQLTGAWTAEASLGSFEAILAAIMRDTWDSVALSKSQSDFTSMATATNVITFGTSDPRTLGFRVGDVVRATGLTVSAANNVNMRVTALTATTMTVDLTIGTGSASTTCTLVRPKKLWMQGAPAKTYFTIEEYDADIDLSELAQDFLFGSMKFSMAANGLLTLDIGGTGTGQIVAESSGDSPVFTSPTLTTTSPLSVVDATIRVAGTDVVDLSAFDIMLDIKPVAPAVFGSGSQKYSPDVFPGALEVSLNLTALRKDLQRLTDFLAETVYTVHLLAPEPTGAPANFFSGYIGNFTLGDVQKSALSKTGGARTQTLAIPAALVGIDNTGAGYTSSMASFQSTGV